MGGHGPGGGRGIARASIADVIAAWPAIMNSEVPRAAFSSAVWCARSAAA
jgi:hypothetical protein